MKLSDDVSRYRPAQYESKRKRNCNTVDIICKKKYYMHNYLELSKQRFNEHHPNR